MLIVQFLASRSHANPGFPGSVSLMLLISARQATSRFSYARPAAELAAQDKED